MANRVYSRSPLMRQIRRIARDDGRSVERAVWGTDLNRTTWWRWVREQDPPQLVALEQVLRNYGYAITLVPIDQLREEDAPPTAGASEPA
jgi:hypothetical protein